MDLPSRGHPGQQIEEISRREQAEPEDEQPIGKVELDRPIPQPVEEPGPPLRSTGLADDLSHVAPKAWLPRHVPREAAAHAVDVLSPSPCPNHGRSMHVIAVELVRDLTSHAVTRRLPGPRQAEIADRVPVGHDFEERPGQTSR